MKEVNVRENIYTLHRLFQFLKPLFFLSRQWKKYVCMSISHWTSQTTCFCLPWYCKIKRLKKTITFYKSLLLFKGGYVLAPPQYRVFVKKVMEKTTPQESNFSPPPIWTLNSPLFLNVREAAKKLEPLRKKNFFWS